MHVSFEKLRALDDENCTRLRALYEASNEPSIRKPFTEIAYGIASGRYICHVGVRANKIIAFAFLLPLATGHALLEYFAVDGELRGQGIGTAMMHWLAENNGKLVWEVEALDIDVPRDDRQRRIAFYERLGAKRVEHVDAYAMPDFETGDPNGVPLWLYSMSSEVGDVYELVRAIYAAAYPAHHALRERICQLR